jgi:hypothetical protein
MLAGDGKPLLDDVKGWVYLHDPAQVDAFEVTFHAISKDRDECGDMWELPNSSATWAQYRPTCAVLRGLVWVKVTPQTTSITGGLLN